MVYNHAHIEMFQASSTELTSSLRMEPPRSNEGAAGGGSTLGASIENRRPSKTSGVANTVNLVGFSIKWDN